MNGAAAGGNGLTLAAGDSTIKGLMINRFSGHGILIQTKGNNVIQGNIIGTNAASAAGLGNGGDGISIDSQSGNTIGSLAPGGNAPEGARPLAPSSFLLGLSNVIAGNSGRGISILSALGVPDLNKILTNAIGTDFAGKSGIGNALEGIFLQSAIRTTIQNTVVGSSGKCGIAAELKLAAAQQQLQQLNAMMLEMTNSISGAFKTFNSALPREARPKSTEAIQSLFGGFGSIFSGPTVPLGNFLGGLCMEEILSGVANPATTVKILGSLFAANQGPGIAATKTNAIQMLGSMVGTDENGAAGLGNTDGVSLLGSLNSILGDPNFASNLLNVVAGNSGRGIAIQSQAGLISDLNKIFGTYVGTDLNGKTGLGNGQDGVQLMSALRTIVQGSVLAGNGKCGMSADLKLAEAQQQLQQVNGKLVEMINTVSGAHKKILSLIGQRARPASEKIPAGSLFGGIGGVFASATNPLGNFLGGACLEQILTQLPNTSTVLVNLFGSLLAANSGPGVSATNVMGLQMQGSIVGTDENGGTGLGNTDGMLLKGLKNSVLGDPNFVANLLNVVAGNSGRGVADPVGLPGLLSDVNKIFGTYVGTDLNGKTGLGNGQDGVQLMSALRTTVQGTVLAGNGKCGMSADLKLAEAQQQLQQLNVKVVEMINTISGSHKKILSLLGQRARPASVDIGGGLFGGSHQRLRRHDDPDRQRPRRLLHRGDPELARQSAGDDRHPRVDVRREQGPGHHGDERQRHEDGRVPHRHRRGERRRPRQHRRSLSDGRVEVGLRRHGAFPEPLERRGGKLRPWNRRAVAVGLARGLEQDHGDLRRNRLEREGRPRKRRRRHPAPLGDSDDDRRHCHGRQRRLRDGGQPHAARGAGPDAAVDRSDPHDPAQHPRALQAVRRVPRRRPLSRRDDANRRPGYPDRRAGRLRRRPLRIDLQAARQPRVRRLPRPDPEGPAGRGRTGQPLLGQSGRGHPGFADEPCSRRRATGSGPTRTAPRWPIKPRACC